MTRSLCLEAWRGAVVDVPDASVTSCASSAAEVPVGPMTNQAVAAPRCSRPLGALERVPTAPNSCGAVGAPSPA
jgi:hypothetical protein